MRFETGNLAAFQSDFLQAVTAAKPAAGAMRVYQDTFFYGLIDSLCEVYEISRKAIGDEAFRALARDYIRSHPPSSGDRGAYGDGFAVFLEDHPHLGELIWLPCLVRFEWALHLAHHAADAAPCSFETLLDPAACVCLHPSARQVGVAYDVKTLYTALVADRAVPELRPMRCDLLIGRDTGDTVIWLCLAPIEVEFLALIARTRSLFAALEQLAPTTTDMTVLQGLLAKLVQNGQLILSEETP